VIAGLNGAKRFVWLSRRIPKESKIKKPFLPENIVKNLEIAGFL
jgi:hypothetical protein